MKKTLFATIGLLLSLSSYSQNYKPTEKIPKGWSYCPGGTIKVMIDEIGMVRERTISISSFIMSNEITNKEFREFYDIVEQTPNDIIYWIDIKEAAKKGSGEMVGVATYIRMKLHKDVLPILFDRSVWNKDFFLNPRFDNYPVAGVTYEGARLYCIWKTAKENKTLSEKGDEFIMDYRIPTEYEWKYAASFNEDIPKPIKGELHEVKKGTRNALKIKNLEGNVSEWTSSTKISSGDTLRVVKGGFYKHSDIDYKELVKKGISKDYIGFRIVRSVD